MLQHCSTWTQRVHSQPMWKCCLEVLDPEACHSGSAYECSACDSQYTHESAVYFPSEYHFLGHVRIIHASHLEKMSWTEKDLLVLAAESSVKTILEPNLCPICYLAPENLEQSGPNSMHSHVAEHLQLLMLLSLRLLKYPNGHSHDRDDGQSISGAVADQGLTGTRGKQSEEHPDDDKPLSPFASRPQSPTSSGDQADTEKDPATWSNLTDELRDKKQVDLDDGFDQTLHDLEKSKADRSVVMHGIGEIGNADSKPLDTTGLCLLSLDGGGVPGLSSLYILKGLMDRLNDQHQSEGLSRVKPCQLFDLIGGTSTGG
jgi:hypothetical protein